MREPEDEAHIYVFEAIIAGMLILTAILFLTGLSAPSQSQSSGGIDLGRIAGDSLDILGARDADCDAQADPAPDPIECPKLYDNRLEEIVDLAMRGDSANAEEFLEEVLPAGTRYLMRIDNGVEPLSLLPQGAGIGGSPRGARAAEVFVVPDWTANVVSPDPATQWARPGATTFDSGAAIDFSTWGVITAPNGETTAPDGTSWRAFWGVAEPTLDRIPHAVPYGLWDHDGTVLRIHGDAQTDYPVYAIQLLIWPGA